MRNNGFLFVLATCCISILSVNSFANKAAFIQKIVKGAEKGAKSSKYWYKGAERSVQNHDYWYSRTGIVGYRELEKNMNHDSTYHDTLLIHFQKMNESANIDVFFLDDQYKRYDFTNSQTPQNFYQQIEKFRSGHSQKPTPHINTVVKKDLVNRDSEAEVEYNIDFLPVP